MINTTIHNTLWYETRLSPTALVLRTYKNDIYTILIQNTRGHRWWILPNGKMEEGENSQIASEREFNEESWWIKNNWASIVRLGNIATIFRKAWTKAKYPNEVKLLKHKSYLFLKEQSYELFVVEGLQGKQIELDASQRVKDIENCQIIKITPWDHSRYEDVIKNSTDREVVRTLTDYLGQSDKSLVTLTWDIDELRNQLIQTDDRIFE